jgi:hypothetical protein
VTEGYLLSGLVVIVKKLSNISAAVSMCVEDVGMCVCVCVCRRDAVPQQYVLGRVGVAVAPQLAGGMA